MHYHLFKIIQSYQRSVFKPNIVYILNFVNLLIKDIQRIRPLRIHYPAELPAFSSCIKNAIERGTLLDHLPKFIRECAAFISRHVEYPTPEEYSNFGRTITEKIPVLSSPIGRNTWVRNVYLNV